MANKVNIEYAFDKDQNLVHVLSVPNGYACGCTCPDCGEPLQARHGSGKNVTPGHRANSPHFAHKGGAECAGAKMTVLHLLAQEILSEAKAVMLPDYKADYYYQHLDNIRFGNVTPERRVVFDDGCRIPDCMGEGNEQIPDLWIEIYVTHPVTPEKLQFIKDHNVYCIEIDCRGFLKGKYTKSELKEFLLNSTEERLWINCPHLDLRAEEALQQHQEQVRKQEERIAQMLEAQRIYDEQSYENVRLDIANKLKQNFRNRQSLLVGLGYFEYCSNRGTCELYDEAKCKREKVVNLCDVYDYIDPVVRYNCKCALELFSWRHPGRPHTYIEIYAGHDAPLKYDGDEKVIRIFGTKQRNYIKPEKAINSNEQPFSVELYNFFKKGETEVPLHLDQPVINYCLENTGNVDVQRISCTEYNSPIAPNHLLEVRIFWKGAFFNGDSPEKLGAALAYKRGYSIKSCDLCQQFYDGECVLRKKRIVHRKQAQDCNSFQIDERTINSILWNSFDIPHKELPEQT